MSRNKLILLILINSIGVIVSAYSLLYTLQLNNYISNNSLVCDVNKTITCSATYTSDYAFVFSLPTSLFAVLFFWFVLTFLLLNSSKKTGIQSYQLLAIINSIALIICACFLFILIIILRNICISCLIIDFTVLLNFILLFKFVKCIFVAPNIFTAQVFKNNLSFLLSFVILFAAGIVFYGAYQHIITKKNKVFLEEFYKQVPVKHISFNKSIIWGNKNGKVEIRIFNDFLCGYCKIASEKYRKIFKKDTASVKIEFICYPLNFENKIKEVPTNIDIFLSKVMLAAGNDKNFWGFHDQILKQSHHLDSALIFGIAEKYLNDFEGFRNDFFSNNYDSVLIKNSILVKQYNVKGTPAIYINGREFEQWTNIKLLEMIISESSNTKP
jgi:protein-disulfide isomerase/uncharacterized membrane protein